MWRPEPGGEDEEEGEPDFRAAWSPVEPRGQSLPAQDRPGVSGSSMGGPKRGCQREAERTVRPAALLHTSSLPGWGPVASVPTGGTGTPQGDRSLCLCSSMEAHLVSQP